MEQIPLDETERIKHIETIARLCEENPDQCDFIQKSYAEILQRVSPNASIRTYLTILITREVKTLLKIEEIKQSA